MAAHTKSIVEISLSITKDGKNPVLKSSMPSQADLRDLDVKELMKREYKKIYYKMSQGTLLYSSDKQGKLLLYKANKIEHRDNHYS